MFSDGFLVVVVELAAKASCDIGRIKVGAGASGRDRTVIRSGRNDLIFGDIGRHGDVVECGKRG